jgi:hypothetical protein
VVFFVGYIKSPIFRLKNTNPLSLSTTIPSHAKPTPGLADPAAPDPRDIQFCETMPSYVLVGKYLVELLKEEIRANTVPEVFDGYEDTESIINDFRQQFAAYTSQEPPFTYRSGTEP